MGGQGTEARLVIQAGSCKAPSPIEHFVSEGILCILEEACFLCSDLDFWRKRPSSSNRVALVLMNSRFFLELIWRSTPPPPPTLMLMSYGGKKKIKASQIFWKQMPYGKISRLCKWYTYKI